MSTTRKRTGVLVAAIAGFLLAAAPLVALAAPADLDPSFDGDGKVLAGSTGPARSVALQGDGKIVAAGDCVVELATSFDFCLARYDPDGSLDATFGKDGLVTTDFGASFDVPWAVAIQDDGRIVAAGECGPGASAVFCLARYTTDGSLDTSFDGDGLVSTGGFTSTGQDSAKARALLIQDDGKLVVAGSCSFFGANLVVLRDACMARYNTDGSLDSIFDADPLTHFNTDGKHVADLGTTDDVIYAAALQPADGMIVVGGNCGTLTVFAFCLARFTPIGIFDSTFASSGVATTVMGTATGSVTEVLVADDGGIVAFGGCFEPTATRFCTARYTGSGFLDTTFSGDGKVTTLIGGHSIAGGAALQADGKIVGGGGCSVGGFNDFCLVRYATDGTLDGTFGSGGTVTTAMGANNDSVMAVAVTGDGGIIAGGGCPTAMCLARYLGDKVVAEDTEAPEITIEVDAADAEATSGWYNAGSSGTDGVLVRVSATDATAVTNITCTDGAAEILDVAVASGSFTLGDGTHAITCVASDGVNAPGAASGSTAMPVGLDVDQVAPTIACFDTTLLLNAAPVPVVIAALEDATSGTLLQTWVENQPDTSTAGLHQVVVVIDDRAGNTTQQACGYRVTYDFTGFAAPISSASFEYVNAVTGKAIPFRFTLRDGLGQGVTGLAGVSVSDVAGTCAGTSGTLVSSDYSKGKAGLVSLGGGSYEFRWKAPRGDRNQCRLVGLTLPDDVTRGAAIRFAP